MNGFQYSGKLSISVPGSGYVSTPHANVSAWVMPTSVT
jgi:hypothetical protein